jgi:hypothetical protein
MTFSDDWSSTSGSGQPAEWRAVHATVHAGFKVVGGAAGAWTGGAIVGGTCLTGVGCVILGSVAVMGGGWAGSELGGAAFEWVDGQ